VQTENVALRADISAQINNGIKDVVLLRAELQQLNKSKAVLRIEVHELRTTLYMFLSKADTDVGQLKADVMQTTSRLDQCEANSTPFVQMMERRRVQEEVLCRGEGLRKMLAACCLSQGGNGNGHRRFLQQVEGCDASPATCSAACAPQLIEYFEGCQQIIDDLASDERHGFQALYGNWQEAEQAVAAMLEDARPAMIFHVLVLSDAAAQQAQMTGGGGGLDQRRVCTTANLDVCVPQCNNFTYGFLLSIEIDGRGTVMMCNKVGILFSWQGQASLGGYIGSDASVFFSSVVSGAASTYLVMLDEEAGIDADLSIERGQLVFMGYRTPAPHVWARGAKRERATCPCDT
jgi:hypothetical protein